MPDSRTTIFAAFLGLAFSQGAFSQWLDFANDTGSRLVLVPFADNPGGDPMDDDQEKDVAVGDLNLDGWDDLIIVRKRPFSSPGARQDVLLLNENGVLVDRTAEFAPGFIATFTDARDVIIGDFTGDEWPDVVIANTFFQQPTFYRNLGNDEKGNWLGLVDESSSRFPNIEVANLGGPQFCAVWSGDVTGNEAMDLYFSNYAMAGGTTDVLLINDGSGNFTDETASRLGSYANVAFGTAVQIQDMDDDGDNDIVKVSTLYSVAPFDVGVFILFNNGAGVFDALPFQEPSNNSPYYFAVGDLDGNGLLDIFVEQDPQDQVNLATSANPDGPITYSTFTLSSSPRTSGFGGNTKVADVDNDGDLDVGVGPIDVDIQNCGGSSQFALLRNPGNGHVVDPWSAGDSRNIHIDAHDFEFIDVNNDGCMDIFMGLCIGWRVFIQENCSLTTTPPDDFNAFRGFYDSGDLDSLLDSDDDKLCYEPGIVLNPTEAPVTLDFFGTLPNDSPTTLDVTIESSANTVGLELTFSFWNFNTNSWDVVGADTQSLNADTVRTFAGDPLEHVEPVTGEVRTRYEVRVVSFIFLFPWTDCVDHVFWTTTN